MACLACVGYGRRVQTSTQRLQSSPYADRMVSPKVKAATLLLRKLAAYPKVMLDPAAAFKPPSSVLPPQRHRLAGRGVQASGSLELQAGQTALSAQPKGFGSSTPSASRILASRRWQPCRACVSSSAATADNPKSLQEADGDEWLTSAMLASQPAAPLLAALREAAAGELQNLRFPQRKDEAWRQTDLSSLRTASIVAPSPASSDSIAAVLADCSNASVSEGMRVVLVDGVYSAELSDLASLPTEVQVRTLSGSDSAALKDILDKLEHSFPEKEADPNTALGCNTFATLNHASLADVVSVQVPAGVNVDKPLHIVMISTATEAETDGGGKRGVPGILPASHPNIYVTLCDGASLNLVQQYAGLPGGYFVNGLSRFDLGCRATLQHSYLQEQSSNAVHIDTVLVEAGEQAEYKSELLQSGGAIARVNMLVRLNCVGALTELSGLTLASDQQLIDLHTRVEHLAAGCRTEQEHRNGVAGAAHAVWRGAVVVPQGSDRTVANQKCRTLLLSDKARISVAPTLQIDTDDVECTHGATVCDLDDDMVFYLQARGLSQIDARALLLQGWAASALENMPLPSAKARAVEKAKALILDGRSQRREKFSSI